MVVVGGGNYKEPKSLASFELGIQLRIIPFATSYLSERFSAFFSGNSSFHCAGGASVIHT